MSCDDLSAALAALPDSWRRSAVVSMMRLARSHADDGAIAKASFWHALAIVVDDAIRADAETFKALTADLDPDAGVKGGIVGGS